MDSMDLKGIAWVGHIYQKFEAMCLEVEEAMCQETAKYVDNQVQTVGAGVKRFCSDVMQDLIPPSSKDLSRVASADLLLNPYLEFGIHKKSVSNIKEDAISVKPVCVKGTSEDKSNFSNDVWEDWSAPSFNWETSDKDEEDCVQMDKSSNETPVTTVRAKSSAKIVKRPRLVSSSNILRAERTGTCESSQVVSHEEYQAKSSAKIVKRPRCVSSSNILRAERTGTCESSQVVSHEESQANSNKSSCQSIDRDVSHTDLSEIKRHTCPSQIDSNVGANTQCGQSVGDDVFRPHAGSSADCDSDAGEETKNDVSMQTMEPSGHEPESGFEEMCVLVDGNDCLPSNNKEEIRRSYKKKIQNALFLKKKSSRKQEYKQLAAQYCLVNAETNRNNDKMIPVLLELTPSENVKANKLATHDSLDSEWELL